MCRCGTSGYGLVGMVVLGGWLDLMILEVFFNLCFYDSIFIFIGHSWKYLAGCVQNQVVAFSQLCYAAGL